MTMAGYLLDTNIVIWELENNPRLDGTVRQLFHSGARCAISIVSLWEIAIKASVGKLAPLRPTFVEQLTDAGFTILPLQFAHLTVVQTLPLHHRDPFDRMLIAQAKAEGLVMITADRSFAQYGIATVAA